MAGLTNRNSVKPQGGLWWLSGGVGRTAIDSVSHRSDICTLVDGCLSSTKQQTTNGLFVTFTMIFTFKNSKNIFLNYSPYPFTVLQNVRSTETRVSKMFIQSNLCDN